MTVQPKGERLLIEPILNTAKTSSGLHLPESSVDAPVRGEVVNVGHSYAGPICCGDIVYYNRFSGTELTVAGVAYLVIAQRDVLAFEKGVEVQ